MILVEQRRGVLPERLLQHRRAARVILHVRRQVIHLPAQPDPTIIHRRVRRELLERDHARRVQRFRVRVTAVHALALGASQPIHLRVPGSHDDPRRRLRARHRVRARARGALVRHRARQ